MMDYDQLVESNKGTIQALMIANRRADTAEARAKRAETNAGDLQQYADCLAKKHATLAAEVEQLKAENAALREQLDAAGWRGVTEAPEKNGYYLGWNGKSVLWAGYWPGVYYPDSSPWVDEIGLDLSISHWRPLPAPPQE